MKWLYGVIVISLFLVACSSDLTGNLVKKMEIKEEVILDKYIDVIELQGEMSDLTIIDIREKWKYNAGHIPGSMNIPLFDMDNVRMQAEGVHKDERIVLYDEKGVQSESAYTILTYSGFKKVQILTGGYNGWVEKELTVEQTG